MVLVHTIASLLSYVAFLVAFGAGCLFLIQERQIKHKRMGVLFHRLPSLDQLERVNVFAIGLGFALLTVGLSWGLVVSRLLRGAWWSGDPKEILSATLWVCYLILWLARLGATMRGRRVALLSVLGFALVLFTFVGASWLVPTWHPSL
ncbi:MAG: cytochrome c biogenesis protein CcsA [Candidatus Omnitrophota bacterium]|nr:cytochrome c biogenesis protein CcsA [Candidatus Omnitrophota bacterium]